MIEVCKGTNLSVFLQRKQEVTSIINIKYLIHI